MAKSQRVRAEDVRQVFRIVGECRELGDDSLVWRRHLGERLQQVLGASVVMLGEFGGDWPQIHPTQMLDFGWDGDQDRLHFQKFLEQGGMAACDVFQPAFATMKGPIITTIRTDHTPCRDWYASLHFNDFVRASSLDDRLSSFYSAMVDGRLVTNVVELHRPNRDKLFTPRDRNVVQLLHEELVPLLGRQLALVDEPAPSQLSPRLQEILAALLEGDSEKQVAAKLNLTPATVHQYVKTIYRHFRVSSRGELLAIWIRRSRGKPTPPAAAAERE